MEIKAGFLGGKVHACRFRRERSAIERGEGVRLPTPPLARRLAGLHRERDDLWPEVVKPVKNRRHRHLYAARPSVGLV